MFAKPPPSFAPADDLTRAGEVLINYHLEWWGPGWISRMPALH
jgi:hypothetical protein